MSIDNYTLIIILYLFIDRLHEEMMVTVARNIDVLYVSSRFTRSKTIRGGQTLFPGYGECVWKAIQA